jgi:spermidine/putrescine transport system ATP-binding protein
VAASPAAEPPADPLVAVCDVARTFGRGATAVHALRGVSFNVSAGQFTVVRGRSGCGKTTLLNIVGGLDAPTRGTVQVAGRDVTAMTERERLLLRRSTVAFIFQSFGLIPTLSAAENVGIPLRITGTEQRAREERVRMLLSVVGLEDHAAQRPNELSGGEQQRVALARALVLQPSVLLLDEPLGALDAKLRRSLKVELKALQEQVGITFLYVTHDQEEALTMSDRLAVMRDGKIVQIGPPTQVYEEPADTYVADFLGVSNLMEVDLVERGPGSHCQVRLGDAVLSVEHGGQDAPDRAHAVIRPERVRIEEFGTAGLNRVPAMVERLVYLGSSTQVFLRLAAGADLQALLQNDGSQEKLTQGTPVQAFLAPDALRVLGGGAQTADPTAAAADDGQAGVRG